MMELFYLCFTNSLNMAFFILLLVLLEPLLKRYFSAVCLYRIWVILLIGLLIPIRFDATKSLFYISLPRISVENKVDTDIQKSREAYRKIEKDNPPQKQLARDTMSTNNSRKGIWNHFIRELVTAKASYVIQNRYFILSLIWSFGAIFLLTVKGVKYYLYRRWLKRFIMPIDEEDLMKEYSQCIQELHCNHRKIKIHKCSVITGPMSIGIFRPAILLPEEAYSQKDLYFIFRHELIHILRRDSLIKLIRLIVLSLNWYNPLCYILSRHLEEWCEVSCDEQVLRNSTRSDCLGYGELLLKYTEVEKQMTSMINMIGGNNMKNRLRLIVEHRKKRSSIVLVLAVLCAVFTTAIVSASNRTDTLASDNITVPTEEASTQIEESEDAIAANNNSDSIDSETPEQNIEVTDSNLNNCEAVVEYAIQAEGTPYIWGGNDLSIGVDSSGFTQAIYKEIGYDIPRTSREQAETFKKVSLDSLQPGDLIFYASSGDNEVNHVGIYIGEDKIIHAKNAHDGVTIQDINYRKPLSAGRVI